MSGCGFEVELGLEPVSEHGQGSGLGLVHGLVHGSGHVLVYELESGYVMCLAWGLCLQLGMGLLPIQRQVPSHN